MAEYSVWATNDPFVWTQMLLETDVRQVAFDKAQEVHDKKRFKFIAIDRNGKTIWSNDPETPATSE